MTQHEKGFYKALRQVSHLFNFNAEDERFDIDKDVYEGSFIAVEDIPVAWQQKPATSPKDSLVTCIFWFYELSLELWYSRFGHVLTHIICFNFMF